MQAVLKRLDNSVQLVQRNCNNYSLCLEHRTLIAGERLCLGKTDSARAAAKSLERNGQTTAARPAEATLTRNGEREKRWAATYIAGGARVLYQKVDTDFVRKHT